MAQLSIRPNAAVPYEIRYGNDALIVVDKPAGVVTQPGKKHEHDSLLNGLFAEFGPALQNLGEVRDWEFGSPPCGWVFAVGVDPGRLRRGVASALLAESCRRFRRAKVDEVRTMVRRTDVPVQSFFRANGFVGGPFVQLERSVKDDRDAGPEPGVREADS